MSVSEWVSIISLLISLAALIYSFISNTKRYELTYQYYNDILLWHNQVVEVLTNLRLNSSSIELRTQNLSKLSALIETGRFYFPNIDNKDGFGMNKPSAYQGYRDIILDFLVYEYQLFRMDEYWKYLKHAESLQRLYTSYVFKYLEPRKQKRKVHKNTTITSKNSFRMEDFLNKSPESIFNLF